jgi:hypothetical protein
MGFCSYETAWTGLHKLQCAPTARSFCQDGRDAVRRKERPALHKELVLAATDKEGPVPLTHTADNDAETSRLFYITCCRPFPTTASSLRFAASTQYPISRHCRIWRW